jgi:hypothetical protein
LVFPGRASFGEIGAPDLYPDTASGRVAHKF